MTRTLHRWLPTVALVLLSVACSHYQDLTRPATQDNYGVQMARMNLWREAMFRFHRAVEINPGDAMAHNNLAVAYEANGDFELARKEYLEALKLDRSNQYIQKNYSRYVEFLSRNRKRQAKDVKTAATPAPNMPAAGATGTVISNAPPDQPAGVTPAKPTAPPTAPPTDRPPQPPTPAAPLGTPAPATPVPTTPPTPPPGGAR